MLKHYVASGGSLLVLLAEEGESRYGTNINFLLEEFGIVVNAGMHVRLKERALTIVLFEIYNTYVYS